MGELNALIVGAGIAGLTCAISLARHGGVKVTILEKAPTLVQIGNGIQVPCNAAHVLQSLGLLDKLLAAVGEASPETRSINYSTGEVLLRRDLSRCESLYGAPWLLIHRGDYLNILQEEALRLGVQIIPDCDVKDIETETPFVRLENGQVYTGDVIIGCDGIHSAVRAALHPTIHLQPTPDIAYRCVLDESQLASASPAVRSLLSAPICHFWLGSDCHAVLYPLRKGTMLNLVMLIADESFNNQSKTGDTRERVRAWIKDWDPVVREMVDLAHALDRFPLRDLPELPSWDQGRVVLAGDAAHPTPPYLAQGAAMAVEDGHILGTMLGLVAQRERDRAAIKARIPDVLRAYTAIQRPRTANVVAQSKTNGVFDHLPQGPGRDARDREFAAYDMELCVSECPWIDSRMNRELLGRRAGDVAEEEFVRLMERLKTGEESSRQGAQ